MFVLYYKSVENLFCMCILIHVFCFIYINLLCKNLKFCDKDIWHMCYQIYMDTDIWQCREGQLNTFCRGKSFVITYLLQGEFCCRGSYHKHKLSSSKRGRMLKPTKLRMLKPTKLNNFDDGQVMMDKHLWLLNLSWRFWVFLCIFRKIVKSLEHTHKYLYSRLI